MQLHRHAHADTHAHTHTRTPTPIHTPTYTDWPQRQRAILHMSRRVRTFAVRLPQVNGRDLLFAPGMIQPVLVGGAAAFCAVAKAAVYVLALDLPLVWQIATVSYNGGSEQVPKAFTTVPAPGGAVYVVLGATHPTLLRREGERVVAAPHIVRPRADEDPHRRRDHGPSSVPPSSS